MEIDTCYNDGRDKINYKKVSKTKIKWKLIHVKMMAGIAQNRL